MDRNCANAASWTSQRQIDEWIEILQMLLPGHASALIVEWIEIVQILLPEHARARELNG